MSDHSEPRDERTGECHQMRTRITFAMLYVGVIFASVAAIITRDPVVVAVNLAVFGGMAALHQVWCPSCDKAEREANDE